MATLDCMTKKPSNKSAKVHVEPRPKSRVQASVRDHFIEPADRCAKRLGLSNLSELVNIALREKLEREGFWPPKE